MNSDTLKADEAQLSRPPLFKWFLTAGITGVIFIVGIGGLGTLVSLDGAAVASGVVAVVGKRKTVQHLEGGKIREILVSENATVEKSDVLFRLDAVRALESLELLQGQFDTALAVEARLTAEKNQQSKIYFPSFLTNSPNENTAKTIRQQTDIFRARRAALNGRISMLNERISHLKTNMTVAGARYKSATKQLKILNEEISGVTTLVAKGLVPKQRLRNLESRAAQLTGQVESMPATIQGGGHDITEARLLVSAQRDNFQNEVIAQLQSVQNELSGLEHRIQAATDLLDRTEIRAPISGVVVNLRHHSVDGVIRSGEPILDIVPKDASLTIKVRLDPRDVDVVQTGQKTNVRLTSYSQRTSPLIVGHVKYISADRLVDESSGKEYYDVRIDLSPESLRAAKTIHLYPGMPAEVFIITERRSALDYILSPIARSFSRAFRES